MPKGLKLAIAAAGGVRSLAEFLGVSHQAVYRWDARGWVPPQRAAQIEKKYKIPRRDLINPRLSKLMYG